MATLLQKLFGKKGAGQAAVNTAGAADHRKSKQEKIEGLTVLIAETLALYNSVACPCAFPRFRQIAGIDCIEYGAAFYATETELFIEAAKPFYEREILGHPAANAQAWTCKTCGSLWWTNWQDFSISVSRTVLKCKDLRAVDAGAAPRLPVPLYVGLSGHSYPGKTEVAPVSFEEFKAYVQERIR